jgi:NADH:ubiquinone oxidoreductase subunit E
MKVQVCTWNWCKGNFSEYILARLNSDKEFYENCDNIILEEFNCLWDCKNWPNILVDKEIHTHMTPARASEIIFKNKKKKK